MAVFRKVQTSFWSDPYILDLEPNEKLFYLYLMTNERTKQCGIYEISIRQITFDTGFNKSECLSMIDRLSKDGKLRYSESTQEIALKNWAKYNSSNSPQVKRCIDNELLDVKNRVLIQYVYSKDTQSQEEEEQEEEKKREEEQNKLNAFGLQIFEALCEKWNITEMSNLRVFKELYNFVLYQQTQNQLEVLKRQATAYFEYKKKSGDKGHAPLKYIGESMDGYNGGWNQEDWEHKLLNYKDEKRTGTKKHDPNPADIIERRRERKNSQG